MDPKDQPPSREQTWAESSPWARPPETTPPPAPAAWPEPAVPDPTVPDPTVPAPTVPESAVPPVPALSALTRQPPWTQAAPATPARAANIRHEATAGTRWMVIWAVLVEVIAIGAGCNQWVSKRVFNYTGLSAQPGFAHQLAFSTQTFAWRVTKRAGESTGDLAASWMLILVVLVLTAALVAVVLRTGSFWRAALGTLVIVTFSTQVGAIIGNLFGAGLGPRGGISGYVPLSSVRQSTFWYSFAGSSSGGGRATNALFGSPTGYRFVGGVLLGILVGVVVGIVARRLGAAAAFAQTTPPRPLASTEVPPRSFFPPGQMQSSYEARTSSPPLAAPGSVTPRGTDDPTAGGRHSRPE